MALLILIPIFLLPGCLLLFHLYQRFFDGNTLMLGLAALIIILGVFVYSFYLMHWDEKLTLATSKYALRFNDERQTAGIPLLTKNFIQHGNTWDTKLDSISDKSRFVLIQKMIEENDQQNAAEQEFNFMARALNDSQVQYLKIQYNFTTKNYYGETSIGKLSRPSYSINALKIFDECCTEVYNRRQVDSILAGHDKP